MEIERVRLDAMSQSIIMNIRKAKSPVESPAEANNFKRGKSMQG